MTRTFSPAAVRRFRFTACGFRDESAEAELGYALDLADGGVIELVERVAFPAPAEPLEPARREAFTAALRLLHLVAGMSYYKTAAPPEVVVDGPGIGPASAALLREIYLNGLGEFAYTNGLDLDHRLHFPAAGADREAAALPPSETALVAVGGGKDSLVSVEALRATGRPAAVAVVGTNPVIHRVAGATGLEVVTVRRTLAPELFELNRQGALNGHVAITAIVGAALLCAAILRGDGAVVLSNERSASEGNRVRIGALEVNHQYSKSLGFERLFAGHLAAHVVTGVAWFSLLRPLSELAICRLFAGHRAYHELFTSCNANFRLTGEGGGPRRWCLACPKCHFVQLALAPFLDPGRVAAVFGANRLDDPAAVADFAALLGADAAPKPFECVGTFAEARAAVALLARDPERRWAVVRRLVERHPAWFEPAAAAALIDDALSPSPDHLVPAAYRAELDALLGPR